MLLLPALLSACLPAPAAEAAPATPIDAAFSRLYNFDFAGAHRILDQYLAAHPRDALGHGVRAAAYLFHELDRLKILETEFFADDKKISGDGKLTPDPIVRQRFFDSVGKAQQLANARLAASPGDKDALFALCISEGLVSDYKALVEKKQLRSLSNVRQAHGYALRLLEADPNFQDAYLSTGVSEYLIGSLPFFIRWFVRIDQVDGSKQVAIRNMEQVAAHGRYLAPLAEILLAIVYLREKQPEKTVRILDDLCRKFPENPLFRKELAKVTEKLRTGELKPSRRR